MSINAYLPQTNSFLIIVSSIIVSLSTGTLFVYSIYVPQLSNVCKLSTSETANLSFAVTIGTAIGGFLSGILTDLKGTQLPIFLGGVFISIGYRILYWAYANAVDGDNVIYTLMFAMLLIGMGSVSGYFATIKAVTINFPHLKGTAQSLPIASFAIASFVFSMFASKIFHGDVAGFLKFLSITCGSGCLIGSIFVKDSVIHEDHEEYSIGHDELDPGKLSDSETSNLLTSPYDTASESTTYQLESSSTLMVQQEPLPDIPTLKESLTSPLFLSHYVSLGLIQGIGQMYIYSIGFIIMAQFNAHTTEGLDIHDVQALHVSIISITSFLGRVVSGPQSDLISKKYSVKRVWNLVIGIILLTMGQIMATVTNSVSTRLCFVSGVIGYSYGFLFGTYPSIISDSFHLSQFSTVWGCLCTCSVITTSIMTRVFGEIYEKNSIDDGNGGLVCLKGIDCYKETFEITEMMGIFLFFFILFVIYFQRDLK